MSFVSDCFITHVNWDVWQSSVHKVKQIPICSQMLHGRRDGYYSNLVKHMGDGQSHWLPQDPRGIIVDMIKMMKLTTKNGARSRKYR